MWDFTDISTADEAEAAQEMAYKMVRDGVQQGTVRADQADALDYGTIKDGAGAAQTFDAVRETSAKIDGRWPGDGLYTGVPMYGSRRSEYFKDTTEYKSGVDSDGNIGHFANLRHPGSVKLFEEAFGKAGKALHSRLQEGGVLTQEQGDHLFATSARAVEKNLQNLRSDSPGLKRLSETAHWEVMRIAMKNGGRLPDHLVGAYKTGDMVAFAKAHILHSGAGKVTADDVRERMLTALDFTDMKTLKAQGVGDADKVAAKINGMQGATGSGAIGLPFSYKGTTMTSKYGMRTHPILGYKKMHTGIDFGLPHGSPVHNMMDGEVVAAGWGGSFGKHVRVRHSDGRITVYAHLSKINVAVGDKITKAHVLGAVGNTGRSKGAHLHLELWKDNTGKKRLDASSLFPKGYLDSIRKRR